MRGMRLDVPRSATVRPPLEMVRQAVFNILGQDMEGLRVADVFAGSGVVGIEALSRGASHAVFVERDRDAVACIRRNIEKTGLTDAAEVIVSDAFNTRRYLAEGASFDLVFLDPPFAIARGHERSRLTELLESLFASPALPATATVVLRVPVQGDSAPAPSNAVLDDDRTYGNSRVLFYRRPAGAAPQVPLASETS